jgi:hypothetical protein
VVDKFNDLLVSCYSTAGNTRLLLLHDSRASEDAIRSFFQEVHELYVKARCHQPPSERSAVAACVCADVVPLCRLAAGHAEPVSLAHDAHHVAAL